MMMQHSKLLGDDWNIRVPLRQTHTNIKYPAYFKKPLHGFQQGGICEYQAHYQSSSMRYIMRLFQGDSMYREVAMSKRINEIKHDLPEFPTVLVSCMEGEVASTAFRAGVLHGVLLTLLNELWDVGGSGKLKCAHGDISYKCTCELSRETATLARHCKCASTPKQQRSCSWCVVESRGTV